MIMLGERGLICINVKAGAYPKIISVDDIWYGIAISVVVTGGGVRHDNGKSFPLGGGEGLWTGLDGKVGV